jgi:hypothetical protein
MIQKAALHDFPCGKNIIQNIPTRATTGFARSLPYTENGASCVHSQISIEYTVRETVGSSCMKIRPQPTTSFYWGMVNRWCYQDTLTLSFLKCHSPSKATTDTLKTRCS